jgi:hypothetical protein
MSHPTLIKADVVIGEGKTQILIEKQFKLKWPLKKMVDEQFDVDIFHTEVCTDKVLFNGEVQKNLIYKTPFEKPHNWRTEEETEGEARHWPPPEMIEQQDGLVVFHEEVIQFAGFVNIKGARAGDDVQIIEALVKDCTVFISTKEHKGLIWEGKQKFIVDVVIKVTRHEQIYVEQKFPPDKKPPYREEE